MKPQAFAALAALCFAATHIASKRGAQTTSVVGGLLLSLATGWLVLLPLSLVALPPELEPRPLIIFVVSGLVAPALGRAGNIAGVHRLGPSTSIPIQSAVYPLFAVLGGVVLLDEPIRLLRATGAAAIIIGVALLSRQISDRRTPDLRPTLAVVFPVIAGFAYGGGDLLRKQGIDLLPYPAFAAMLGVGTAFLAWLTLILLVPKVRTRVRFGTGAGWFVLGGVLSSTALLFQFHALRAGDVSLVSPIVAAQPLVVLILSARFLRDVERPTVSTVMGATATVAGVMLLSM